MTPTTNRIEIHPAAGKQPYWRISDDWTRVRPDPFPFYAYAVTMAPSGWQSAPNAGSSPYIRLLTILTTDFEAVRNRRRNRDTP